MFSALMSKKPPLPDDIFFLSIGELHAQLKGRQISATELTKAYLKRLETLGPQYNALAHLVSKPALRKAWFVDKEFKRDRLRAPLQGIPYGAMDLLAVAGSPTAWGAKPFADQVLSEDATVIKRLDKAGAILIGKLAMVELAGGGGYRYPSASMSGPGLNPWDRSRWSGGSSSGPGSAVAAGLAGFAIGSETSGSILTPSAYCGVTGLRPTYGLVSRAGAMALSWTLDKIGPMCRSAEDCGFVLDAIAGGDDEDPSTAGKSFYYTPEYVREWKDIRVGFAPADFDTVPADPAVRNALRAALDVVKKMEMLFTETTLPDFPYTALTGTIISAEAASIFEELISTGKVDQLADQRQAQGLKAGLEIPAKDYLRAMRIRTLVQAAYRKLFSEMDVLIAPTRYTTATKVDERLDRGGSRGGLSGLIPAANLAGLPALSLPCGFADGLPVAIQLVGRPFSENLLLKIGAEFQKRTDWHRRKPPGMVT
jgi:aspartyl-tRNA(Asn)/glutamyl-tRNA(Gln) amidotransferase subunit A